jgi:glycosyltransferase involved in cell wall biosynthesis
MNVLIITNYSFPYGMAQTNRLIAISKGLLHSGVKVKVIISKATEINNQKNKAAKGNYQGIDFVYSTGITVRPKSALKKVLLFFTGIVQTLRVIIGENRIQKVDAIFIGVHKNGITLLLCIFAKLIGIKIVQERSEYPFLSYKNNLLGKIKLTIYLRIICSLFDGFIVISKALESYFYPYLKASSKKLLLPILVENERFNNLEVTEKNTITYCGSMQGSKDGVQILIESFYLISSKFPDTNLKLIGNTDFYGFSELQERIVQLNLSDRIVFTGQVERNELPKQLLASRILALARPNNKQAEGGFPTKLGEYLASEKLVVVTKVGDIPDYLTNEKNALLAEPDSVKDFAAKLELALSNDNLRANVAKEGKKLAQEVFDYKVQGNHLYNWLKTFV